MYEGMFWVDEDFLWVSGGGYRYIFVDTLWIDEFDWRHR